MKKNKNIGVWSYLEEYQEYDKEILNIVDKVFKSGQLILGEEVKNFENNFSNWINTKYGTGVANGTDAIKIALLALGIGQGDEIITVSNTAVPTVSAIVETGASPVFCDVNEDDYNISVENIENLNTEISNSDILIVATSAEKPTVTKEMVPKTKTLTILDLSVPKNVDEDLSDFENVDLLDLDYLSTVTNTNLENRKKFIPDAKKIIKEIIEDFYLWIDTRKFAPTVNALKIKLKKIQQNKIDLLKKRTSSFDDNSVKEVSEHLIQKITNQVANHLRDSDDFEEELESIKTIFQLNQNDY